MWQTPAMSHGTIAILFTEDENEAIKEHFLKFYRKTATYETAIHLNAK